MSWFTDFFWPAGALSDLQRDLAALRLIADTNTVTLTNIMKELRIMAAREDAAYEALTATILTVKDGWAVLVNSNAAKDTEIAQLRAALEAAQAGVAETIAVAAAADSEADAAKVEAANAALTELVPPPAEPPVA